MSECVCVCLFSDTYPTHTHLRVSHTSPPISMHREHHMTSVRTLFIKRPAVGFLRLSVLAPSIMMKILLLVCVLTACVCADHHDSAPLRLADAAAAQAFIDSADVAVIGFFQADLHQEHLKLSEAKKVDSAGLLRFLIINNISYVTEYNQASAVGIFQSSVKTHVLLVCAGGRSASDQQQKLFRDLAVKYAGKMLFILVNGADKSNSRVLEYFSLKSADLPRVGLYDVTLDQKWLMASGEITTERVQNFCDSFLDGELQKQRDAEDKTEL
ncbi:endoplasmic reticulum resident protein 27 isoform X2 [Danio rerio]|uniref:Endoplasmic reticulum resident protein 27 isoform X2 n=1 Tax=Danio rerio TaxID=7955 RepID=A0AC58JSV9_DANRE